MEKPIFVMSEDIARMLGALPRFALAGLPVGRRVLIASVDGAVWAWPLDAGALLQAGTM